MCFFAFLQLDTFVQTYIYRYAASPSHQVSGSLGLPLNRLNLQWGHCAPPHYFRKVPWVGNLKDLCPSQRVHVFGDFVWIKVNEMGKLWDTFCSICVWPNLTYMISCVRKVFVEISYQKQSTSWWVPRNRVAFEGCSRSHTKLVPFEDFLFPRASKLITRIHKGQIWFNKQLQLQPCIKLH